MTSTRQIQSRRSDQDFIKMSLQNDTLTMENFELQGFRAQQSTTRQSMHKSEAAIKTLELECERLREAQAQLTQELDTLQDASQERRQDNSQVRSALVQEKKSPKEHLRALVDEHCKCTGENWSVDDLESALIALQDSHATNAQIFDKVLEIAQHRSASQPA